MTTIQEEEGEYLPVKSIDEEFSRANYLCNSVGLTDAEKVLKITQVKELSTLFPTVPEFWLEMAWQFHHDHPEKAQEVQDKDLWREKSTKFKTGGIIKSVSIEDGFCDEDGILQLLKKEEKEICMNA